MKEQLQQSCRKGQHITNLSLKEKDSNVLAKFLHSGVQTVGMNQCGLYWHCLNKQSYDAYSAIILWLQQKTTTVSQGYNREKNVFSPPRGAGIFERVVLRFCF